MSSNHEQKKDFWENDIVIFFFGPFMFFLLAAFLGSRVFYDGEQGFLKLRNILLVLSGAIFYILLFVVMVNVD